MIFLSDSFHTDIDGLQFRLALSPVYDSNEWILVYPYEVDNVVGLNRLSAKTVQAVIESLNVSSTNAEITLIDSYDTLYTRRALNPQYLTGSYGLGETNLNISGGYQDSSLKRLIQKLQTFYATDGFFANILAQSNIVSIDEGKTEPVPIFTPNTIAVIEMLYQGKWYPIFAGLIRRITTGISRMGRAYRQVTLSIKHPFEVLKGYDFVHSLYAGFMQPDLFKSIDMTEEEKDLYMALWIGQYDNVIVDALNKSYRGLSLTQYMSLPEILHLIHHVGNLRLFAKYIKAENHHEAYEALKSRGIPVKDLDHYINTYNEIVKQYSPLKYFADNNIDLFGEYEETDLYIAREDIGRAEALKIRLGVREDSFSYDRYLPFTLTVDKSVAECDNKSFQECTDMVRRIYQGVLSVSFSFYLDSKNRKTIKSIFDEMSSVLQLDTYLIPNGWAYLSYPAMFKPLDDAIVSTIKEAVSMNHVWDVDSLATVTSGYAGQDFISINAEVIRKPVYWGVYIDVPNTVRYGMKEINAPTVYYPTWGADPLYKELWRTYLKSFQLVVNAHNYSASLQLDNIIIDPAVFYAQSKPVFLAGLDWIFTLSSIQRLSFNFVNASLNISLGLTDGIPMSMYDYIHNSGIKPLWKVVRDSVTQITEMNLDKKKQPVKKRANTPVSRPPTGKRKTIKSRPNKDKMSDKDKEVVGEVAGGKPGTENKKAFADTVVDALSFTTSKPSRAVEFFPNRAILQVIENVFYTSVLPPLREEWVFDDYEIVVTPDAYHPEGYLGMEVTSWGFHIKGIKLLAPVRRGRSSAKFLSKFKHILQEDILRTDVEYEWIPVTKTCGSSKDPHNIDWEDVAMSISEGIQDVYNANVSIYEDICGSIGVYGDARWRDPWIKKDSGVWVLYCSSKYAKRMKSLEKKLKQVDNEQVVMKYGNVVSVIPVDYNHYSDIYLVLSWNLQSTEL